MLLATSIAAVVWIVCLSWLDKMQPNMFDKLQLLLSYRISVDYSYSCMSKLDNLSKQSAVIKSDVTNINILPLNIIGDWSRLEPNFTGIFHRMRIKLMYCWLLTIFPMTSWILHHSTWWPLSLPFLASGSFNMLFAASMVVSGRIEVDMFILPFEVLFDEKDVWSEPTRRRRCEPTRRRRCVPMHVVGVFRLVYLSSNPYFSTIRIFTQLLW